MVLREGRWSGTAERKSVSRLRLWFEAMLPDITWQEGRRIMRPRRGVQRIWESRQHAPLLHIRLLQGLDADAIFRSRAVEGRALARLSHKCQLLVMALTELSLDDDDDDDDGDDGDGLDDPGDDGVLP
eukprot:1251088-Rhodomonas_salina.3